MLPLLQEQGEHFSSSTTDQGNCPAFQEEAKGSNAATLHDEGTREKDQGTEMLEEEWQWANVKHLSHENDLC